MGIKCSSLPVPFFMAEGNHVRAFEAAHLWGRLFLNISLTNLHYTLPPRYGPHHSRQLKLRGLMDRVKEEESLFSGTPSWPVIKKVKTVLQNRASCYQPDKRVCSPSVEAFCLMFTKMLFLINLLRIQPSLARHSFGLFNDYGKRSASRHCTAIQWVCGWFCKRHFWTVTWIISCRSDDYHRPWRTSLQPSGSWILRCSGCQPPWLCFSWFWRGWNEGLCQGAIEFWPCWVAPLNTLALNMPGTQTKLMPVTASR